MAVSPCFGKKTGAKRDIEIAKIREHIEYLVTRSIEFEDEHKLKWTPNLGPVD